MSWGKHLEKLFEGLSLTFAEKTTHACTGFFKDFYLFSEAATRGVL